MIFLFKDKALFAKDAEITHAVVIEKMNELVSERGRRVSLILNALKVMSSTDDFGREQTDCCCLNSCSW